MKYGILAAVCFGLLAIVVVARSRPSLPVVEATTSDAPSQAAAPSAGDATPAETAALAASASEGASEIPESLLRDLENRINEIIERETVELRPRLLAVWGTAVQSFAVRMQAQSFELAEGDPDRLAYLWYAAMLNDVAHANLTPDPDIPEIKRPPGVRATRELLDRVIAIHKRFEAEQTATYIRKGIELFASRRVEYLAEAERHPTNSIERAVWRGVAGGIDELAKKYAPPAPGQDGLTSPSTSTGLSEAIAEQIQSDLDRTTETTSDRAPTAEKTTMRPSLLKPAIFLRDVPVDLLKPLVMLDRTAHSMEVRGYLSQAREDREAAITLARESLPPGHFMVQRQETLLADCDWLADLTDDDRSIALQAYRDIQNAMESITDARDRVEGLKSAMEQLEGIASPATDVLLKGLIELCIAQIVLHETDASAATAEKLLRLASGGSHEMPLAVFEAHSLLGGVQYNLENYHLALRSYCAAENIATKIGLIDSNVPELIIGGGQILDLLDEDSRAQECVRKLKDDIDGSNRVLRTVEKLILLQIEFNAEYDQERFDKLQPIVDKCFELGKSDKGENSAADENSVAFVLAILLKAKMLCHQEKFDEAWTIVTDAETSLVSVIPKQYCGNLLAQKAAIRTDQRRYAEAAELSAELVKNHFDNQAVDRFLNVKAFERYTTALEALGRKDEAQQMQRQADELRRMRDDLRDKIRNDPECRYSWERKTTAEGE